MGPRGTIGSLRWVRAASYVVVFVVVVFYLFNEKPIFCKDLVVARKMFSWESCCLSRGYCWYQNLLARILMLQVFLIKSCSQENFLMRKLLLWEFSSENLLPRVLLSREFSHENHCSCKNFSAKKLFSQELFVRILLLREISRESPFVARVFSWESFCCKNFLFFLLETCFQEKLHGLREILLLQEFFIYFFFARNLFIFPPHKLHGFANFLSLIWTCNLV